MSRPVTRSKNSTQHPGQILLEGKQKRRTSEQKQADDAQVEQSRREQVAAREQGFKRVANIIDRMAQEEENLLTNPPKPRPRIVVKSPVDPSTTLENSGHSSGAEMVLEGLPGDGPEGSESQPEDSQQLEEESDDEILGTQILSRMQRRQKTVTRDAVQAALQEVRVGSSKPEKQKQLALQSQASTKNTITGVGEVKDWADKLASSKYLNTLPSQRSTSSNSRHARSISSGTGSLIKDPCATPLSSGTRLSTPTSDNLASESQECDSYIQGGDQGERKAMHNPSSKAVTQQTNVMDIAEVISDSEPGEWVSPPPIVLQSRTKKGGTKGSNTKDSKKRIQQSDQESPPTILRCAPPSKRTKAAPHSTSTSQRSGSGVNKKYVKDDLPPGSTVDNIWRRVFISTLAHFTGGYDNPWTIPSDQFALVLQRIWDAVYGGED
ncbi:hypothetical protein PAXINDRAFT_21218 [Paxillus involutus ATCC 200175]|uniref:Unplaced genomic scaffold PAXINscaffold_1584, whole genome shotgun sequence n=1 Tax=Paxillus involutus ATCC 200175 TaxID=664439 RepID=A0A0C9TE91_PAXIN|nr:hypothetical protein PAXINDRAFT_21218 [Paxillus involutus ATCC 200175]